MKCGKALAQMVTTLRRHYSDPTIEEALSGAEMYALHRHGRQITPADWDAFLDSYPVGEGPQIVTSWYVPTIAMLADRADSPTQ